MGNILGDENAFKKIIREQKRINNRSLRELDRELKRVNREEAKALNEMKRLAMSGQMLAVKHLAKDVIRMKESETKFIKLQDELRSLSAQMDEMETDAQLQNAMKPLRRTLGTMGRQIKLPELQAVLQKYEIESEVVKFDMTSGIMDESYDASTSAPEYELIEKVMNEIGLKFDKKVVDAPIQMPQEDLVDDDLQKRLEHVKAMKANATG